MSEPTLLRAGGAQVKITPPVGSILVGQFRPRVAEAVHDDVFASALALDDGQCPVVFVAADILSLRGRVVRAVRAAVDADGELPGAPVFLSATHTHTGPAVCNVLGTDADETYVAEVLIPGLVEAVRIAWRQRVPARVGVASGRVEGFNFPRRYWKRDGTVRMHPPKGSPDNLRPQGEADPSLHVLFAEDAESRVLGVLVNYACHPIVVGGGTHVSADYPGGLRQTVQQVLGADTPVLFGNGPCADLAPFDVDDPTRQEYGFGWWQRMGQALGGETLKLLASATARDDAPLAMDRSVVDLPTRPVTPEMLAEAERLLGDAPFDPYTATREQVYAHEWQLLAAEGETTAPAEVFAVRVGNTGIVGLPGEVFVEFGRHLRAVSPLRPTLVVELANGCVGYVPTAEAFVGGGYETELARSSKLTPAAGPLLVNAAVEALERTVGTL
jgi:hypothetical protein